MACRGSRACWLADSSWRQVGCIPRRNISPADLLGALDEEWGLHNGPSCFLMHCDHWPSYDLPLVIEIEMLEFPEGITRRADPIPDEQE